MDTNDIINRFNFHDASILKNNKMDTIRKLILDLGLELNSLCPDSREKSLAFTNLEEVMFWANASISRNP